MTIVRSLPPEEARRRGHESLKVKTPKDTESGLLIVQKGSYQFIGKHSGSVDPSSVQLSNAYEVMMQEEEGDDSYDMLHVLSPIGMNRGMDWTVCGVDGFGWVHENDAIFSLYQQKRRLDEMIEVGEALEPTEKIFMTYVP